MICTPTDIIPHTLMRGYLRYWMLLTTATCYCQIVMRVIRYLGISQQTTQKASWVWFEPCLLLLMPSTSHMRHQMGVYRTEQKLRCRVKG